ncbi:MAG: hypothetical protein L6W00_18155 [Lentisphaeria bacterium]|nr:MAG: hypothetical protein L6W00_18155 [Lentisphaeria bacterium]
MRICKKKRQNSINAFRIKKDSGKLCSDAKMYGIRYLGNGKIEVIPEWVEIIRFVYDNICAYRPYRAIIRDCNERWGRKSFSMKVRFMLLQNSRFIAVISITVAAN